MNMKKIIAFLLAAQMLLSGLVACGKDEPEETKAPVKDPEQTEAPDPDEPEETKLDRLSVPDGLPEKDFNNRDFRFLVDDKYAYQLYSEDDSGVGLDAVIYDRNKRVEQRYKTKISFISSLGAESQDMLVQYAQVGEHIAEVCAYEQYMGNTPACYYCWTNLKDIPYLNFDQPWWNKQSIESCIINDYIFNVAGDLSLTAMQYTWCHPFNMDLMEDFGYDAETLYNLVWDGEWTLDKLIEITSTLWVDDGDGEADADDKFGFGAPISGRNAETGEVGCATRTIPWITALGERAITVGEDRKSLVTTLGTESMYQSLEKLVNFHNATKGANKFARDDDFVNGNVGIYTAKFDIFFSRSEDINFSAGVLPMPKANTAQEKYLSAPDTFFTMFGVPITLEQEDYEFVGIMMEVLNAESWKTVYPAYYDEALKGRFSTDENMAKMIELITDSRVYEYGILCAQWLHLWKLPYMICYCISDNNIDLASQLAEGEDWIHDSYVTILSFFDVEVEE